MWLYIQVTLALWVMVLAGCGKDDQQSNKLPHIVFILVDDMGWNDVSFHGSNQIPTPNIDSLAYHGVILNRHYVQPLCTPTRASLMTGKYPIHTGLHEALGSSQRAGLDLSERIMPQYFKELGYSTQVIGKWHLGFYKKEFTPLQRGFDSHFGYWNGAISYYDHIVEDPFPPPGSSFSGHDMRRNYTSAWDMVGKYATDIFTEEAVNVINHHSSKDKPLFLYLAHLATHAGNEGKLLEAPQEEINQFSYISNPNRRTYAAMVSKVDKSVGAVVDALEKNNMLQDSIIVFLSDNGAPNIGIYANWGSNYPYRGQKSSLWEGAVRTPALIWSPLIQNPSTVSDSLMHVVDWLPTLLAATGCKTTMNGIDGVNQWTAISEGRASSRSGLVVDVNDEKDNFAIVVEDFKYVKGPTSPSTNSELSKFLNLNTINSPKAPAYEIENIVKSVSWQTIEKYSRDPYLPSKIKDIRQDATVTCDHDFSKVVDCNEIPCLFNIKHDPCEQFNIASFFPMFVDSLEGLLQSINIVPNVPLVTDSASNPELFNGTWSYWVHSIRKPSHYHGNQ